MITKLVTILAFFHFYGLFSLGVVGGASLDNQQIGYWWPIPAATEACSGSIEECATEVESDEYQMDSEINRRVLAMKNKYIGYEALKRNHVPCSRRGVSYYNCRGGAPVNPYTRGCSRITRCRGGG